MVVRDVALAEFCHWRALNSSIFDGRPNARNLWQAGSWLASAATLAGMGD
jgi:hypothetical protein